MRENIWRAKERGGYCSERGGKKVGSPCDRKRRTKKIGDLVNKAKNLHVDNDTLTPRKLSESGYDRGRIQENRNIRCELLLGMIS